jgi:hypothetical protein
MHGYQVLSESLRTASPIDKLPVADTQKEKPLHLSTGMKRFIVAAPTVDCLTAHPAPEPGHLQTLLLTGARRGEPAGLTINLSFGGWVQVLATLRSCLEILAIGDKV